MTMNELIETHSLDRATSEINRATILNVGEAIRQVVNENFPQLRYPVIAGGAIRDTIFGLPIKDFDIFFDTAVFEAGEEEDIALLLIAMTCEKLAEHEYPKLRDVRFQPVGHKNQYTVGEGDNLKEPFVVYENYPYENEPQQWVPGQVDFLDEAIAEPARLYEFPQLQVIGHNDQRLREDPVAFLEYFDYGLVRGLYDPSDLAFHLHPSLQETLVSKQLPYNNIKTQGRLFNFMDKLYTARGGNIVAETYTMVDNLPKVDEGFTISTGRTGISTTWTWE